MSDCKYDKKIIHGSESDKKALVSLILKVMEDKSPKQYVSRWFVVQNVLLQM